MTLSLLDKQSRSLLTWAKNCWLRFVCLLWVGSGGPQRQMGGTANLLAPHFFICEMERFFISSMDFA